jgi:glycosyltransferase involved in cell wall biosynthesis
MPQPLVSVKVPTYNHERYVGQCLAGIVAQRTAFPFEVIVGDDASTDGTRAVIEGYAADFPHLIRLLPTEPNAGAPRNLARLRAACRGVYEAMCEGDDCWIRPDKLQRQVDFLEAHSDYVLCFHNALCFSEDGEAPPVCYCPRDLPDTPTLADVISQPVFIPTASILARRTFLDSLPAWREQLVCADLVVRLWSAHVGRIGYLNPIMSLYRRHQAGMTVTTGRRKMAEDAIRAYQLFDETTEGQYAGLLRQRIRFERQYLRWGSLYYLAHPARAIARLRRRWQGAGL